MTTLLEEKYFDLCASDVDFERINNEFDKLNYDELIEIRRLSRNDKNWKFSDYVRNYLDDKLVFVFDATNFQEVYFLTNNYFKSIEKIEKLHNIKFSTKRKFVEWKIKQEIKANNDFDGWLFTQSQKIQFKK